MGNTHRILWFDECLRQNKYPNGRLLAEKFEISTRQASRDIEYLKNTLHAPLRYIPVKRGFIYEDSAFVLPNIFVSDEEKSVLNFLAYKYENYDGTEKNIKLSDLFKKLSGDTKTDDKIPVFDLETLALHQVKTIKKLILEQKKAYIHYNHPLRGPLKLHIHPYSITGKFNTDYLTAYCEDLGEVRQFRLDRILRITGTDEHYKTIAEIKPEALRSSISKIPFKAIIKCADGLSLNSFAGRDLKPLTDGRYEVEFYNYDEFIDDLLISKAWREILFPEWIREKLEYRCNEILKRLL
ncbi:MAG: WYL domain-containing protein [Bacillota bacterium]|nr:WYL domain-containing protein [Bacillota bacterium]